MGQALLLAVLLPSPAQLNRSPELSPPTSIALAAEAAGVSGAAIAAAGESAGTRSLCPDGWRVSPDSPSRCLGVPRERASSLSACVDLCAAQGSTPACIRSVAENNVAGELIGDDVAWLGIYQHDTSREPAEGWGRCVDGEVPSFTNWAAGEPNNCATKAPEDCAVKEGQEGQWGDRRCKGGEYACLCATSSSTVSDNFEQDLVKLEANLEARLREIRVTVSVVYSVAAVISLLPTLLVVGLCLRRQSRSSVAGVPTTSTHEQASVRMARRLRQASRSAAWRRLQVSGAMGQVGWALVVYGILPAAMAAAGTPIDNVVGEKDYWCISVRLGFFLGLLALFPTDERAIRTTCTVFLAFYLGLAYLYAHRCIEIGRHKGSFHGRVGRFECQRFFLPKIVAHLSAAAALAATLPCGGCKHLPIMQPRQALQRMWAVLRLHSACYGMLSVGFFSTVLAYHPHWSGAGLLPVRSAWIGHIILGLVSVAIAAIATPANRGRVTRWLGRVGGRGSEAEEAAAIAALVGRANPERALADAEALFRCLPASRLTAKDLASSGATDTRRTSPVSTPAASDLAAKSIPARLGEVTAFLSHSWKDEEEVPGAKYAVIAHWAHCQRRETGHEPTLWLDKACIDQTNIDQALTCLPIFLAGCQRLLVVAGPTFCRRLWCLLEIFTFLRMGGSVERIEVLLIADPRKDPTQGQAELTATFQNFDAAKAECFLPKDRERLLAVIEAGFGDVREFNKIVRRIFARAHPDTTVLSQAVEVV